MKYWKDKRIVVTGGNGFLGKAVVNKLLSKGVVRKDIVIPNIESDDLTIYENCLRITKGADIVIHLAATVGGILFHKKHPASMLFDNVIMGFKLIEACRENNVSKIINIGSTSSYPAGIEPPFMEEKIWDGYPDQVTSSYGIAKKVVMELGIKYKEEYDMNAIFLMLANLYGPCDNFTQENAQVIPALIERIYQAKQNNKPSVEVWGSGKATREFIFVEDAAEAILLATEKHNSPQPINIGTGTETPIKETVETIAKIIEFSGDICWDTSKPDGTLRRCVDVSKAKKYFGFKAKTTLQEGLIKTYKWYCDNVI